MNSGTQTTPLPSLTADVLSEPQTLADNVTGYTPPAGPASNESVLANAVLG